MSHHSVDVVSVGKLMPHPNADALEITHINGWQVVVRKGQFREGDLAVYVEPNYVVPTDRPEFAFLAKEGRATHRLKAIRLRGELSFGLLIPIPDGVVHAELDAVKYPSGCRPLEAGDDVMQALGITRYEPPVKYLHSQELPEEQAPQLYVPKFDIESLQKFKYLIRPGERVVVTEKIHGANARYVYHDGKFFMGSRNRWIDPETESVWKAAISANPHIMAFCQDNPDTILFGEVYGKVQDLRYGLGEQVQFAGFAALNRDKWIDQLTLIEELEERGIGYAPLLAVQEFDMDFIASLAEGDSAIPTAPKGHMREGVVIVPEVERYGPSAGRSAFKLISNRYWLSNEG